MIIFDVLSFPIMEDNVFKDRILSMCTLGVKKSTSIQTMELSSRSEQGDFHALNTYSLDSEMNYLLTPCHYFNLSKDACCSRSDAPHSSRV